jgi:cyclase
MQKIRVMPTLLYKDFELVKGAAFDSWRRIGSVMQSVKLYNLREVDELVFLDISATREDRAPDCALIDEIADECFMPLTVGGGIRSVEHVRRLLQVGADKVALNTAAVEAPDLVEQIATTFGAQCLVVSIDARRRPDGSYEAFTHSGTVATGRSPVELARQAEARGAGEILLTSIDRDGTLSGYDVALTRQVSEAVRLPVIASGGAGKAEDMASVLAEGQASAVAAAAAFHFTQLTPLDVKRHLRARGFPVRI